MRPSAARRSLTTIEQADANAALRAACRALGMRGTVTADEFLAAIAWLDRPRRTQPPIDDLLDEFARWSEYRAYGGRRLGKGERYAKVSAIVGQSKWTVRDRLRAYWRDHGLRPPP